ncbi:MAG: AAA family ATPase [Clostridiales bacterium]|nr:AAA family ATPase [Clostridiales bacterium]
MLLGCEFINFDVFDNDKIGILIEDSASGAKGCRLRNMTALIGRNNTGKSCFINTFEFIKDCVTTNVAQASIEGTRPGFANMVEDRTKPAVFRMFFKVRDRATFKSKYLQYELKVSCDPYGRPFVESEKVIRSDKSEEEGKYIPVTVMETARGKGRIAYPKAPAGVMGDIELEDEHLTALCIYGKLSGYTDMCDLYREISGWFFCKFSAGDPDTDYLTGKAPGGHKHLNKTGSNVRNVLEYLKAENEEIYLATIEKIKEKIPNMKKRKNLPMELADSPDRLFLYLLLLNDKSPRSTIFMETPDKDLYHDMVDVLADEMREYSINNRYSQIIFSTHNPYIMEDLAPSEVWVFKRSFDTEEGDVEITCAGADPLVEELFRQGVGMGAIWYGGHLDEESEE